MRKSSHLSPHYRPGTSRRRGTATTFREQMTDYARGEVLRELRSHARKSRETVAADVGVTTKTLFTWEKQNGAIKWANAQRLASYYNVEPDSLVTRDADEAAGLPTREQLDRIETLLRETQQLMLALAAGLRTEPPVRGGPPWAALDRLREELAARDRQASQPAPPQRKTSTG